MSVSRKLRRYRGWIAAAVLLLVAGTAYYFFQSEQTEAPVVSYETEAAGLGTISVTISGTGNLEVDGTTEVWPGSAGTVASVSVAEGDAITTGTVLFTLDGEAMKAETARALSNYRQSQQGVAQAEASLAKAERSLTDLQDRYDEQQLTAVSASAVGTDTDSTPAGTSSTETESVTDTPAVEDVTQDDIDQAELDIASAEAGLDSAHASRASALISYEQAQTAEGDLTVASPCSGIVSTLDIEAGDSVTAGGGTGSSAAAGADTAASTSSAPIVISPEQPLAVHLTVNEVDLHSLALGQRADIEFDALPDLTATGKIYEIADEGTNTQGVVTFDVWLSVDVLDDSLRAGMSAAAAIVTDVATNVLVVPNSALQTDSNGGDYVDVLDSTADTPRQVPVETGLASATSTEILSGLSEGDLVVTQTVEDGADDAAASSGGFMMPGMGGGRPQ